MTDESRVIPPEGRRQRWGVEVDDDAEGLRYVIPVLSEDSARRLVSRLHKQDPDSNPVVVTCTETVTRTPWTVVL